MKTKRFLDYLELRALSKKYSASFIITYNGVEGNIKPKSIRARGKGVIEVFVKRPKKKCKISLNTLDFLNK